MKTLKITDRDGKEFTLLEPENKEDLKTLLEMAEEGDLDDRESFGDDPAAFEEEVL